MSSDETNAFIKPFSATMFPTFLILLIEYSSFYQVLVTLLTVIMSISDVLLGMVVTGMSFSAIMTGLGIVALTGSVVKNGIVLIDTYNHYNRDDRVEPVKAMLLTVAQRIRPVLLTAIVTAGARMVGDQLVGAAASSARMARAAAAGLAACQIGRPTTM